LLGTERIISWNQCFNHCLNSTYNALNLVIGSGNNCYKYAYHALNLALEWLDKVVSGIIRGLIKGLVDRY